MTTIATGPLGLHPLLTPSAPPAPVRAGRDLDVDLVVAARRLSYRPDLWRRHVRFDPEHRTWTRLSGTGLDVETWLLTWLPGQGTALHDHGGSRGSFVVVDGTLDEEAVEQDFAGRSTLRRRTLEAGDLRSFGPDHVHQVVNRGDQPAVSLHVYAPSITVMREYRLDGAELVRVEEQRRDVDW